MCTESGDEGPSNAEAAYTSGEAAYDLAVALNYGHSAGSPQFLRFVTEHVEMIHDPPYIDWECTITSGTSSAIYLGLHILCNPGDIVLVEQYMYSGTFDALKSQGLNRAGVGMDVE
ncbi:hypothetical protein BU25DRAFT_482760 [Macroventuria anomochaeta]|uniref:Uncharacterized protein n=1 Tax=Macroventuria anomochaeta TaxID=301207 RepID=A0ACB6RIA7_9PLEO|nr:uncharacterized protein BU25DRAFT_482760 [Macroventuria anomochaeta]KAF2621422.1 hypothetical protein BU25DRAFT_482760 [Macroventuria anomochaeta]